MSIFVVVGAASILTGILPPSNGTAVAPAPRMAPTMIRKIVEGLGSERFTRRERAEQVLLSLGHRYLPVLHQERSLVTDPEIRRRLDAVAFKLERDRALSTTRVTIHAKSRSVREIFEEIGRQGGYEFRFIGKKSPENSRHSVDFDETPFWRAVDTVCNQLGLTFTLAADARKTITLTRDDMHAPFVAYAGPFRVEATNIGTFQNSQLNMIPRRAPIQRQAETLNLSVTYLAEPKTSFDAVTTFRLKKAVDDRGNSLAVDTQTENAMYGFGLQYFGEREAIRNATLSMIRADRKADKIKEMVFTMRTSVTASMRLALELDDVLKLKDKKFSIEKSEYTVESVECADGRIFVNVRESSTPYFNRGEDSTPSIALLPENLEIVDAAGRPYVCCGFEVGPQANVSEVVIGFGGVGNELVTLKKFEFIPRTAREAKSIGPPAKLRVYSPVMTDAEFDFIMKDIPLP